MDVTYQSGLEESGDPTLFGLQRRRAIVGSRSKTYFRVKEALRKLKPAVFCGCEMNGIRQIKSKREFCTESGLSVMDILDVALLTIGVA
jgi:hypothetical protein